MEVSSYRLFLIFIDSHKKGTLKAFFFCYSSISTLHLHTVFHRLSTRIFAINSILITGTDLSANQCSFAHLGAAGFAIFASFLMLPQPKIILSHL